jgi:hypothetical protein
MIPMTQAKGPRDFAPERYRDYLHLLAWLNAPRRPCLGTRGEGRGTVKRGRVGARRTPRRRPRAPASGRLTRGGVSEAGADPPGGLPEILAAAAAVALV